MTNGELSIVLGFFFGAVLIALMILILRNGGRD